MVTPTAIVGYLALFVGLGFVFMFVSLWVGSRLRPKAPNAEKLEVYECGEPTIGSSFVQFDLRFYVVALLFIIFDVEIAFFFPWANVYGKSTQLMDENLVRYAAVVADRDKVSTDDAYRQLVQQKYREMGFVNPAAVMPASGSLAATSSDVQASAKQLARLSIFDILVFFGVLMVGFAYVWRRGDLDWVRAIGPPGETGLETGRSGVEAEPALSA